MIEALADGGVKQGVPRQMALQFAAQTVLGAAKTVLQTGKHPAVLRDEVSFHHILMLQYTEILIKLSFAVGMLTRRFHNPRCP